MSEAEHRKIPEFHRLHFKKTRTSQEVRFSVFLKNADIIGCDAGKIMSFVKDDDPTVQVEQDDNKVSNIKLIDANGEKK